MYREGLLILAIILIIVGAAMYYLPSLPDIVSTVGYWIMVIGGILLIIWIVLFAIRTIKSGG